MEKNYKTYTENHPEHKGYIDYRIYDNGEIVLMGDYTEPEFRKQGVLKLCMTNLLNKLPKGCIIYDCIANLDILPYYERLGFEIIEEPIPYWGKPTNGVNVKMIL